MPRKQSLRKGDKNRWVMKMLHFPHGLDAYKKQFKHVEIRCGSTTEVR